MISGYIFLSIAAFLALVWLLRADRISLGLPVAYLALLLLNHLPGAYAHAVAPGRLGGDEIVEMGLAYTSLGAFCFVVGVGLARLMTRRPPQLRVIVHRPQFALFCLLGGWFLIYGLTPLRGIPSIGAAIVNGGAIWILGVALGLRSALHRGDGKAAAQWAGALLVYPVVMLVLGGFLSYGAAAIVAACSILAVSVRSNLRVVLGLAVAVVVCMNVFVNYFGHRDEIRRDAWGGASTAQKIDTNLDMVRNFEVFDHTKPGHLQALDLRLNQNYFVGLAAIRLKAGQVEYLHGRSVSDSLLSLVPRVLWPNKPVFGGSPKVVSEMTGLRLSQTTSWGVGQVMEFLINFGAVGIVLGFISLGWLIGWIDVRAALAEAQDDLGRAITFFLPGLALLQPIGSLVELSGSAAAALAASIGWRWAWTYVSTRRSSRRGRRVAAVPRP